MKKMLIILIIGLVLLSGCNGTGATTGTTNRKSSSSKSVVRETIKDCPYECCVNANYKRKDCGSDYDCISNRCVARDTDRDGLSDLEERQYGTSSTNADTDGDGLTDYVEIKQKGTNPLKRNTDNDRYDDNEDPNPLVKNSADVNVNVVGSMGEPNFFNIGLFGLALASVYSTGGVSLKILAPILNKFKDSVLYTYIVSVKIENNGNDYTNYVNFDLVFKLRETKVGEEPVRLGKFRENQYTKKHYTHDIKLKDLPETLLTMLDPDAFISMIKMENQWDVSIENIEYEKF